MVCIYCGNETKVTNSRHQRRSNQIWRRRQCLVCKAIFSTEEQAITDNSLLVIDGKRSEAFQREKLLLAVYDSLKHRKTAVSDATALADTIWSRLLPKVTNASLQRNDIVRETSAVLKRFDKAAATSYLAFHPLTKQT